LEGAGGKRSAFSQAGNSTLFRGSIRGKAHTAGQGGPRSEIGLGTTYAPLLAQRGLLSADGAFAATSTALSDNLFYIEKYPTSPLIISPFSDPLPIPKALAPVPKSVVDTWSYPPGPGRGSKTRCGMSSTRSGQAGSVIRTPLSTRST
jgi:hypothetical protein